MQKRMKNKGGQVTIFVILAILIVAVLVIIFLPNIRKLVTPATAPEIITQNCLGKNIKVVLNETLMHGGVLKPELYFLYKNVTLDYLCYTGEWYKTCIMQKPLLKQEIENQVTQSIQASVQKCISDAEQTLVNRGYDVKTTGTKKVSLELQPEKAVVSVDVSMTIKKDDLSQTYPSSNFRTSFTTGAYDMIMIASSIQNFEARYGDSTPETYMAIYPNIKVQKLKQSDGTKVYIITNRESGEVLQFATRSLAWPPGYAIP